MDLKPGTLCQKCEGDLDFRAYDFADLGERQMKAGDQHYAAGRGPGGLWRGARGKHATSCSDLRNAMDWMHSRAYSRHTNLAEVENSAAQGCHLCTLIRLHLPSKHSFNGTFPIDTKHQGSLIRNRWAVTFKEASTEIVVHAHIGSHRDRMPMFS
jgi:hypothetical protein